MQWQLVCACVPVCNNIATLNGASVQSTHGILAHLQYVAQNTFVTEMAFGWNTCQTTSFMNRKPCSCRGSDNRVSYTATTRTLPRRKVSLEMSQDIPGSPHSSARTALTSSVSRNPCEAPVQTKLDETSFNFTSLANLSTALEMQNSPATAKSSTGMTEKCD